MTCDTLPSFIKNIRKELATTRRSVTSKFSHGTIKKFLREDAAFCFAIECSLATNQHVHFSDEPSNEEEAAAQVQQALITSREMVRQDPMSLSKGKV